jgi:limonene-1,2-epoxide hydrolase
MAAHNEQIVRDFCKAFLNFDVDAITSYLTEDAVYDNVPFPPRLKLQGRAAIAKALSQFRGKTRGVDIHVLELVAAGDTVMVEHRDERQMQDGSTAVIPCCGVFKLRDGKICLWRDYFDLKATGLDIDELLRHAG